MKTINYNEFKGTQENSKTFKSGVIEMIADLDHMTATIDYEVDRQFPNITNEKGIKEFIENTEYQEGDNRYKMIIDFDEVDDNSDEDSIYHTLHIKLIKEN